MGMILICTKLNCIATGVIGSETQGMAGMVETEEKAGKGAKGEMDEMVGSPDETTKDRPVSDVIGTTEKVDQQDSVKTLTSKFVEGRQAKNGIGGNQDPQIAQIDQRNIAPNTAKSNIDPSTTQSNTDPSIALSIASVGSTDIDTAKQKSNQFL
eukprot:c12_g1_i1.p2 GENE.c12_g1_i1~~c12_g1_i1.p2  ORF type:complete len:154 (+),score=29.85 c12_g1_i1:633-1094(+)